MSEQHDLKRDLDNDAMGDDRDYPTIKTSGFFVMIRHQKGFPMPLVDENEDVVLFDSEEEAAKAGKRTLMGETFGCEVFEW